MPLLKCLFLLSFLFFAIHALAESTAASPSNNNGRKCEGTVKGPRCFEAKGALASFNGTPTFRVWVKGPKRQLGLAGGESPNLPEDLKALVAQHSSALLQGEKWICGLYQFCPLETPVRGRMQSVCVAQASDLSIVASQSACFPARSNKQK